MSEIKLPSDTHKNIPEELRPLQDELANIAIELSIMRHELLLVKGARWSPGIRTEKCRNDINVYPNKKKTVGGHRAG